MLLQFISPATHNRHRNSRVISHKTFTEKITFAFNKILGIFVALSYLYRVTLTTQIG